MAVHSNISIVDADSIDAVVAELTLTNETVITLYVTSKTGTHNNHRIELQKSPDGVTWLDSNNVVLGLGSVTAIFAAKAVRAKVTEIEKGTATVDVCIVAH